MIHRAIGMLGAIAVLAGTAESAEADQYRYVGIHPIAESAGSGVCHIELPHVHVYAPTRVKLEYRDHNGWHHFIGDPAAYDYEGPTYAYHGAHPIQVNAAVEVRGADPHEVWCYLKGPHYHWYEPAEGASFEVKGDVYWYLGDYPPAFKGEAKVYAGINAVYKPIAYVRPVIEVQPPQGYVDILVVQPALVVEPVRRRPARSGVSVGVSVPVPRIEFGIGVSAGVGVGVGHGHHHRHRHKKYKKYRRKRYKKHRKHRKHRKFRKHWR